MMAAATHNLAWLADGGEMGHLIRTHDWTATQLGAPEQWPQSLKTAIRLILSTRHPAFVYWGPALFCFYNDFHLQLVGRDRHLKSLGKPGRDVWNEVWPIVEPQIDHVMTGKGATWHENQLVPIMRNGSLQQAYWTYGYSPIDDPEAPHGVGGVLVLCTETTANIAAEERNGFLLKLSDALRPLSNPWDIQGQTARLLGEHFGVKRANYAMIEIMDGAEHYCVKQDYAANGLRSVCGTYRFADFPGVTAAMRAGNTIVSSDVQDDRDLTPDDKKSYADNGVGSFIIVPLVKNGRLSALLSAHDPQPRPWSANDQKIVEEAAERTWAAVERARAEAALRESITFQKVLIAELQHRTRNLLTVVQAVASQSIANSTSLAQFKSSFNERLQALSRVQQLFAQHDDRIITIDDLLRMELDALGSNAAAGAISLEGPEIRLRRRAVQMLALAIHELATNARKYGALAHADGQLSVRWRLVGDTSDRRVIVEWHEDFAWQSSPPHRGYGTQLIEKALPYALNAETSLTISETGVQCIINLPVPAIQERDARAA